MTDEAGRKSDLIEAKLVNDISALYTLELLRALGLNKGRIDRLFEIRETRGVDAARRYLAESGLAKSVAGSIASAGVKSVELITSAMAQIDNVNREEDEIGVQAE